jgi:ABC-type phosphate transport system auxiliary subunit
VNIKEMESIVVENERLTSDYKKLLAQHLIALDKIERLTSENKLLQKQKQVAIEAGSHRIAENERLQARVYELESFIEAEGRCILRPETA